MTSVKTLLSLLYFCVCCHSLLFLRLTNFENTFIYSSKVKFKVTFMHSCLL